MTKYSSSCIISKYNTTTSQAEDSVSHASLYFLPRDQLFFCSLYVFKALACLTY